MERRDEVQTNWMGDYFALIGDCLLHSDNGDTCCKIALQLISNGNHKDGSRMLCQYQETILDVGMKKACQTTRQMMKYSVQVCFLHSPHCILNWENRYEEVADTMNFNGRYWIAVVNLASNQSERFVNVPSRILRRQELSLLG